MRIRPENLVISMLVSLVVGCGQSVGVPNADTSECVDIPNGQYFQFIDGRLTSVTQRDVTDREQPPETARRIGGTLAGMGYPWVSLAWDGQIAVISGLARNEASRSDAFVAAKSIFEADPVAGPLLLRVVNNMTVREAEDAIAIRLTQELVEEDGLSWIRVVIAGRVATLVGRASDGGEKAVGYSIGRSTVESDLEASAIINIVVDAISSPGVPDSVGGALLQLDTTASVLDCQDAFDQIMDHRRIEFEPDEAVIRRTSSRLLDAVTGAALLCDDYTIEIAQRLDADESFEDDIDLSLRRASTVRDYLMAYGVSPDALTARGYGRLEEIVSETDLSVPETTFLVGPRQP